MRNLMRKKGEKEKNSINQRFQESKNIVENMEDRMDLDVKRESVSLKDRGKKKKGQWTYQMRWK